VTEPDDETVALLQQLGEVLRKSQPDDLKALLSGVAKLAIVPKSWRPSQTGRGTANAPTKAGTSTPSAAAVRVQLTEATTSDARRSVLLSLNLTQAQARRLATDLGVKGASKATIEQAVDKIVANFADLDLAMTA
jgi:hypothetical protein